MVHVLGKIIRYQNPQMMMNWLVLLTLLIQLAMIGGGTSFHVTLSDSTQNFYSINPSPFPVLWTTKTAR